MSKEKWNATEKIVLQTTGFSLAIFAIVGFIVGACYTLTYVAMHYITYLYVTGIALATAFVFYCVYLLLRPVYQSWRKRKAKPKSIPVVDKLKAQAAKETHYRQAPPICPHCGQAQKGRKPVEDNGEDSDCGNPMPTTASTGE